MNLSVDDAKAQAKALRQALQTARTSVSHAQALELVAKQHGARDWNTLHARLSQRNAPPELALGDLVSGKYLGQAFSGQIIALSGPSHLRQIEIKLDKPIDTVTFDSFSNWRHRIRGTLGENGESHRKTSDGNPQLVVVKKA
ncbi:MAG: glyoxalase superfamily protein [Marivita sp.]|uniref:glyoxalase superfamily protein n=1 Tax=Marivita sp. TaxID=2003365 RepID=UPI0025C02D3D|nr:glyoxalase superfamily protein [Marivita sp.]MCI5110368.1 glyoxalase superfamily protein [Marivita sp.]